MSKEDMDAMAFAQAKLAQNAWPDHMCQAGWQSARNAMFSDAVDAMPVATHTSEPAPTLWSRVVRWMRSGLLVKRAKSGV